MPHHEQQASKWNREKQHQELWPAYNPNIAPPQASTEGFFQQTQAITLRTPPGRVSVIDSMTVSAHILVEGSHWKALKLGKSSRSGEIEWISEYS